MNFKIPLAWLQLKHERVRLLIAIAGISFADILMFMQLGFRDALFDSVTLIPQKFNGDLVLIHSQADSFYAQKPFPRLLLYQALSLKEIQSVAPVYLGGGQWKNPETGQARLLTVLGFNPAQPIFDIPEINKNLNKLKLPDVVLFDSSSRPEFGSITETFTQGKTIKTELNRRQVTVGGLFTFGASFASDGNVIVSDINFLRLFAGRSKEKIDIGLIHLKPGTDLESVRQQLEAKLPQDVQVLTYQGLIDLEEEYWATSTPIGFIFTVGTIIGFVVGSVIVYQILYADVSEHLPEYATLKAMGYTHRYLLGVVFQEALILAVVGYVPGLVISIGLYRLTQSATQLPIVINLSRILIVLILTFVMCCLSGAFAVRRLREADPADIF